MRILYAIALIVGVINMNTAAHANKLDLSRKNLQAIPAELYEESNVEELWLDDNQITQLPEEIQQLSTLKSFSIYKNQLDSLDVLCQMVQLTTLLGCLRAPGIAWYKNLVGFCIFISCVWYKRNWRQNSSKSRLKGKILLS